MDTHMTPPGDHLARLAGQTMTCIVVEDQVMFLELLTGLLIARPRLQVVARARDVLTATAACRAWKPDLLILDLALPDGDGLAVARAFLEVRPDGHLIVLSGHAETFVCPAWLNDRIRAVVSKNAAFDVLRRELDDLLGAVPRPTSGPDAPEKSCGQPLSDREAEVYRLIGEGLSSAEIASRLGVSRHTVHSHRKRIALKLGTQGDELVRRAVAHRVSISPPRS
jgi:DNA-binding NarL/FixJ family response regulator